MFVTATQRVCVAPRPRKMRAAVILLVLLACAAHALRPGPSSVPRNSAAYDAGASTDGTVVVLTAPACNTTYVSGGCMKMLPSVPDEIGAQGWSYEIVAVNGNATRCTFTFSLPDGEVVLPWSLVATSNCANA